MTRGRGAGIDNSIDWIKDEDENVLGYLRTPRDFVGIPTLSADGQSLVGVDGSVKSLNINRADVSDNAKFSDPASWTKYPLQFSVSNTSAPSVYWPWVIATDNISNPLGKFYMYYSTDHMTGAGGIYVAYSNSPTGPWTNYGLVYQDISGSGQTETPSVLWDAASSNFRLYYQNDTAKYGPSNTLSAVGKQSTLSATSTDGLTWTKDPNFILDIPSLTDIHGDGHTGYFNPYKTKRGWFAFSLHGGTGGNDCALWKGKTLSDWRTNRIPLGYGAERTFGLTWSKVEWNHCTVVESRGVEYIVGMVSDGVAGASGKNSRMFVAPICQNYRFLDADPTIIWAPTLGWETNDMRSICPMVYGGTLYLYYSIAKTSIGVISHVL